MTIARRPATLIAAIALVALTCLISLRDQPASAAPPGLLNPGFEDGILGGAPKDWTIVNPVVDPISVADAEGPADFPTYADMGNVSVVPFKGSLMLREGTPKRVAESQNKGNNTVRQTFASDGSVLRFAFRVFSWEHRDNDIFKFDLKSGPSSVGTLASPIVVSMPDGATRQCTTIPCQFSIDVGSRGQYLDTGWVLVLVSNIPVGNVTLSYTCGGTKDQAHGTWCYFDNVNTPPVAKFTYAPPQLFEGDLVEFQDLSYDPDPGDHIVSWEWTIDGEVFNAQNPLFIFPDEGVYAASLKVTDTFGDSRTVLAGGIAVDGDLVPATDPENAAPPINALNVEAIPGLQAPLFASFLDPGWTDTHTASWSLPGASAATVQEDRSPALASGIVTGTVTPSGAAGSTIDGSVNVQDNDGGSLSDGFVVSLVANDLQRREPNNAIAGAPGLASGASYLSHIQSEGDIDVYEALLPSGRPNTQLLVTLTGLPADYDLAIISDQPGQQSAAYSRSDAGQVAFETAAYSRSAYSRSAFSRTAFSRTAYSRSSFSRSAYSRSALTFDTFPLADQAFTGLEGAQIGATDITLAELGLGAIGEGSLVGFSATRGLDDETAMAVADLAGTKFYIVMFGPNGARSIEPYRLQIEASVPIDPVALLGSEVCTGTALVSGGPAATVVLHDYDDPGTEADEPAQTKIFTQAERLRAIYDMDDAAWTAFAGDLSALAQHPTVKADVVSLPPGIFDQMDVSPCSVDAANGVAAQIKSIVQSHLTPDVLYTVFAGSDNVIPFRRVPDETVSSNERDYAMDSFLKPGSPLFWSIYEGYNLTDDYYVDSEPSPWQGRELYVPDLAVARLVETPDEIRGQIAAYFGSGGVLNPVTAFVSGYDFFSDGSQVMADNLGSKLDTTTLINDDWTAAQLACELLGTGAGCDAPADVLAVNAHFSHVSALSSGGFNSNTNDILTSSQVAEATAGGAPALKHRVVFSMGCHSGLSVPDAQSEAGDLAAGINAPLDLPQAVSAIQRAIYVAPTGYGLGQTEWLGGTELLLAMFSERLMAGDVAAGEALTGAKLEYITATAAPTVYDEKSSITATFYGLPMYRVLTPVTISAAAIEEGGANLQLTVQDGAATFPSSHVLSLAATGNFYLADGDFKNVQATAGRAVQPRVGLPQPSGGDPIHGVLLKTGSYVDETFFHPLIASPTNEWIVGGAEEQTCLPSWWPSQPATHTNLDTATGLQQTLVVVPGQFRCTSGAAPVVTGTERLHTAMTVELLRSPSTDFDPPVIDAVDLHTEGGTTVNLFVEARDLSGIAQILVLHYTGGVIIPIPLVFPEPLPTGGRFSVNIPNVQTDDEIVVQVVDRHGNVADGTGKGAHMGAIRVDAGADVVVQPGTPTSFVGKVYGFDELTEPVFFVWDFSDGTYISGRLAPVDVASVPVSVDGDGTATFTVTHPFDGSSLPLQATMKITDSAGKIGVDLTNFVCDPRDAVDADGDFSGCAISNDATTLTIAVRVYGSITDEFQYRVDLTLGKKGQQKQLKYDRGNVTGPAGTVVTVAGNEVRFAVSLSALGIRKGDLVKWSAQTQAGVGGEPQIGFADRMPDSGVFQYTIK